MTDELLRTLITICAVCAVWGALSFLAIIAATLTVTSYLDSIKQLLNDRLPPKGK